MKEHFLDLFQYNEWANQRVLTTLEQNTLKNENIQLLLSHILSSQIVWLNRITNLPTSPFPLWEFYKLRELKSMTEESTTNWRSFVERHQSEGFEETIVYTNTANIEFKSTIREIITHVINHSSYHRGQIAVLLRQEGIDPPATDFIVYARQK